MVKDQETISVRAAAVKSGLSSTWIRNLIWEHKLAAKRVDGKWQIPVAELEHYLAAQEKANAA